MNNPRAILVLLGSLMSAGLIPGPAAGAERMEYDITWVGISLGTMVIQEEIRGDGGTVRSLRMWNRPWIALVYPVDTAITCTISATPEGPCHMVHKLVRENDFFQDDTLTLWPDRGRAVWSNAVNLVVRESAVPVGSRDLVSFFFDLRAVLKPGPLQVGGEYRLVMDGAVHDLEITRAEPREIRTPFGRLEAVPVAAVSKSPTLFSRNHPKSVWVATARPAVLFADIDSRFGPVRCTLVKWEQDGRAVEWTKPKPLM